MNPTKNVSEPMCSRRVRGCCSLWCYKNYTCLNIASQIIWSHEGAPNAKFLCCDVQPSEMEEVAASYEGERIITRP